MSLVVVIVVAAIVFIYVKTNRTARLQWLRKLDLGGVWHWQEGDLEVRFFGTPGAGEYSAREGSQTTQGKWYLAGHTLSLEPRELSPRDVSRQDRDSQLFLPTDSRGRNFELHYFKPGTIGLEDASGIRRIFIKQTSNVVTLRKH